MLLNFKEMLETVPFLSEKDNKFLIKIAERLEDSMHQPFDNIITQGEIGQEMYFLIEDSNVILMGNCLIYKLIFKRIKLWILFNYSLNFSKEKKRRKLFLENVEL